MLGSRIITAVIVVSTAVLLLGLAACGDDDDGAEGESLAGTYVCVHPGGGSDELVLDEDGTLTITPQEGPGAGEPEAGTWELDGNTLTFKIGGGEESFELEDGQFPAGESDCTKSE